MDESVRGDLTSLGNPAIDTTPFLARYPGLANFGVAVSAGNCSLQSRYFMRYGVRPEVGVNVFKMDPVGPTIWKYAKNAEFKTVYINAWTGGYLGFHSLMTTKELRSIDENILIKAKHPYELDGTAADSLREVLKSQDRAFVYLDKFGAHFPYYDTYPPNLRRFPIDGDPREAIRTRDGIRAVYKNAIAWTVDEFFKKVLTDLDLSDTLIIYTSDHGQNLLEGDAVNYKVSHCSTGSKVQKGEAYVPLFAVTTKQPFRQMVRTSAKRSAGRASHYEIFPTLLYSMGYDKHWIAENYGPSLLDIDPGRRRSFLTFWGQRNEID
jgi:glucan phosphoethanolaminetransferase (alkaline phosphatase superfamily)